MFKVYWISRDKCLYACNYFWNSHTLL